MSDRDILLLMNAFDYEELRLKPERLWQVTELAMTPFKIILTRGQAERACRILASELGLELKGKP